MQAEHQERQFKIVKDNEDVGYYLLILEDGVCIRDILQNDLESCIAIAQEDYGVPAECWFRKCED